MKARIKYKKYGALKFISHLEVMRYFQKAMRRADIPIAFSEGFSPHMVMSFASPLKTGFTSDAEYFDIELGAPISGAEAVSRLNGAMAQGIEVLSFRKIPDERKMTGMALLSAADYFAAPSKTELPDNYRDKIKEFLARPEIPALKATKSSEKMYDIRPLIFRMEAERGGIFLKIAAGSTASLSPELAVGEFCKFSGISYKDAGFDYRRLEMYAATGSGGLVSLEELGTEITCDDVKENSFNAKR